ncbi:hypothetical protein IJ384_03715 [bacterium]|nr:hypothetical protein [bacterium]
MDIKKTSINNAQDTQNIQNNKQNTNQDSSIKFSDELKELAKQEKQNPTNETKNNPQKEVQEYQKNQKDSNQNIQFGNLNNKENELNKAINGLNTIVKEFNQSEDKFTDSIKNNLENTDNNNMINNDYNIQDNKEILPQMNPNMNFSGDGQPFSSFMNDNTNDKKKNTIIGTTAQDLAEEAQILSTMAENITIANKNIQLESKVKTIMNEEGVEKVDIKTGIKIETVVKYDTIIMNQADVEVFATLVENKEADLSNLAPKAAEKSVKVSQALADMLIKAKETNQPIRINFDNDISIIIKISRDGKLTADFLPSSQVAEAYLRENLPLLRQRFDEKNLEYDSLNQRERKDSNKENHKKKDRNNE